MRRRVGGEPQLTTRFQALVSHYLFEPCFARPGEGHDKGSVESRGKGFRLAHMSPVPQGRSLEEIARGVLASVEAAHGNHARWQEEQASLRELPPTAFEARRLRIVGVSRQARVQLGGATYSVPSRWKSLQVHAPVGAREITFTCRDEEYCCDLVRPGQRLVRYAHYFEELSRKPQVVRQVAPELLAKLGPAYRKLWSMLESRHGALETARLFAKLLSVVTDHGSEEVASALGEALAADRFDLLGLVERHSAPRMEVPETLRRHEIEGTRAADFDVLLQEAAS